MAARDALVTLDSFKGDFQVAKLLNRLLDTGLAPQRLLKHRSTVAQGHQHELLEQRGALQQLLDQFQRAASDIDQLQQLVDEEVRTASEAVQAEEEAFQVQTEVLEGSMDETQANFQELNAQMTQISQAFAKIGDRLQSAESKRKRALETATVIRYLQEFSTCSDNLSELSELFLIDERLAEAAAMCRKLLEIGRDVLGSRDNAALSSMQSAADMADSKGSIERALRQLEAYRNDIEQRVVEHFDKATKLADLDAMAACTAIMSQFQRDSTVLPKRYINTLPVFEALARKEAAAASRVQELRESRDRSGARTALADLAELCKRAQAEVAEKLPIMEQVFPDPGLALRAFIERLFEGHVEVAVSSILQPPPAPVTAEGLQQHVKLITEAYKRLLALADGLQEMVGSADRVRSHVDEVFNRALSQHVALELQWLCLAASSKPAGVPGLSMQLLQQIMEWHGEAAERCRVLYTGEAQADHVCQLFCSWDGSYEATTGCLLQQVCSHVSAAIQAAVQHCEQSSQAPVTLPGASTTRSAVPPAAARVVTEGPGRVLGTLALAAQAARCLQQHYARAIAPLLEGAPAAVAATALASALDQVQGQALSALRATLDHFFAQADQTLAASQQPTDFRPPDELPPETGRATLACMLVSALLPALHRTASAHLQAANAESFSSEVGRRFGLLLTAHMQRWTFSPAGALRWICDMGDYSAALQHFGMAAVAQAKLDRLKALANVLLVPVDSLVGVVEGELRLSHRQALPFIRLRSDFKTARVDGQALERIFACD